jgi:hypothetical protein
MTIRAGITARALRLAFAGSVALGALVASAPGAVLADCAEPPAIERAVTTADIVFVGTVTNVTNSGRWAEVSVGAVWRGPDQPSTLVVRGGPEGNTATSVDRSFEAGVTYLFVPYLDPATNTLADNICTSTTQWRAELDDLRPSDARPPIGSTPAGSGFDLTPLLPIGVAVIVFGVLLGIGLLARGRQEA